MWCFKASGSQLPRSRNSLNAVFLSFSVIYEVLKFFISFVCMCFIFYSVNVFIEERMLVCYRASIKYFPFCQCCEYGLSWCIVKVHGMMHCKGAWNDAL